MSNQTVVSECSESKDKWICSEVLSLSEKNGWIPELDAPLYEDDDFLLIISSLQTDMKHYKHIVRINPQRKSK